MNFNAAGRRDSVYNWWAVFGFNTRRRNRLRAQPFPAPWLSILARNVPYYERLSPAEQQQLQRTIEVFVAEKNFESCGGLEMTDEIKVTIAAYACILLLRIENHDYYPRLRSILVYPHAYMVPEAQRAVGNFVVEGDEARAGESWRTGAVVIAWDHVLRRPTDAGGNGNVVFHEFAHQLDQEKGVATGAPLLPKPSMYHAWARILGREYKALSDAAAANRTTLLDKYGATNPAEFFAVATECFFGAGGTAKGTACGTLRGTEAVLPTRPGKNWLCHLNGPARWPIPHRIAKTLRERHRTRALFLHILAGIRAQIRVVAVAPSSLRQIGDVWLNDGRFAVLAVPSAITSNEWNFLINPTHPESAAMLKTPPEPFAYDDRLG